MQKGKLIHLKSAKIGQAHSFLIFTEWYAIGIVYIKEVQLLIVISHKKRINLLATYFIEHDYINIKDIEMEFKISRRSAFYWITSFNKQLDEMQLDRIAKLAQSQYFLPPETKEALRHYDNLEEDDYPIAYSNKYSRRDLIIWFLIQNKDHVSLTKLAKYFRVSKNTVINDFQGIREHLPEQFEIINAKNGKRLVGNEREKRLWVCEQVGLHNNPLIINEMHGAHYRYLIGELITLQRASRVIFSDNSLELLATFLSWCLKRIQLNPTLTLTSSPDHVTPGDKVVNDWITNLMAHYEIPVSIDEVTFFRDIIYSAQTKSVAHWAFTENFPADILVNEIITRFNSISGAEVSTPNLRNGLKAHLITTYQRVMAGIPYRAANLDDIKRDYHELLTLTSYAVQPFEDYMHKTLSRDELALLTTYFGGQTNYLSNTATFNPNVDVFLICSSGVGTSYFLQQTLKRKYSQIRFSHPLSLREFNRLEPLVHAKLIISTIGLETTQDTPKLTVQSIPTDNDFAQIDKALHKVGLLGTLDATKMTNDIMDIISNDVMIPNPRALSRKLQAYFSGDTAANDPQDPADSTRRPPIQELLTPDHIHVTSRVLTWKQAIQRSFLPLLSGGYVDKSYVTEIIRKLEKNGPFMIVKGGVLLAHSAPSSKIHKLGMSLLELQHPVKMADKTITTIICLAPKREKQHLKALSDLLNILEDDDKYQTLIRSERKSELVNLMAEA